MNHKEKQLEYAHQYQTMSAKEWWKVVFSDKKKFNLDSPGSFQEFWLIKKFPEENYSTGIGGGRSLMIWGWGDSHLQENLDYNLSGVDKKAADYVKMLNGLSLAQEGCHLCGEGWIFQ